MAKIKITPRQGDVLADGSIVCSLKGDRVIAGVVLIHRSRLRRAMRLGWERVPNRDLPAFELTAVAKRGL